MSSEGYPDWEAIYLDNVERLYRLMYSKVGNRPDSIRVGHRGTAELLDEKHGSQGYR